MQFPKTPLIEPYAQVYGGPPTMLGQRLTPAEAQKRIFGVMLMNEWSARDVQVWEYVFLGPFLGKNLCTTVAPWIVPMAALEPVAVDQYEHDPPLLPCLEDKGGKVYDVPLTVEIRGTDKLAPAK